MRSRRFRVIPLAFTAVFGLIGGELLATDTGNDPIEPGPQATISHTTEGDGTSAVSGRSLRDQALTRISADTAHTCALSSNGKAYCWGAGNHGRLGNGETSNQATPVAVAGGRTFISIGSGLQHTCALEESGQAWCWGRGASGRLGNGETRNSSEPVAVTGNHKFVSINAGRNHTCALTADGTAYCWGYGGNGKLGNGSVENMGEPTEVLGDHKFSMISAGAYHTCGVTTEGESLCWGSGSNGKRGDGETKGDSFVPRTVLGNHGFASIHAGHQYTCGLTSTGTAYCWGANGSAQLGDGSRSQSPEPVPVDGEHSFTSIAVGKYHTCGVTESGKAYCWGSNGRGKAGVGQSRGGYLHSPRQVARVENFAEISVGPDHSCGITKENKVYCWGNAGDGRLGTGGTSNRASPDLVGDLSEIVSAHTTITGLAEESTDRP